MDARTALRILPLLGILGGCASTGGPGAPGPGCETLASESPPLDQVMDSAAALAGLAQVWTPPPGGGVLRARLRFDSSGVFQEAAVAPGRVDATSGARLASVLSSAVRPGTPARRSVYMELGGADGPLLRPLSSVVQCKPQLLSPGALDDLISSWIQGLDLGPEVRHQVLVDLFVREDGEVADGRVFRSAGRTDIDRFALDILMRARFSPATTGDFPIPVWIRLPMTFTGPSAPE